MKIDILTLFPGMFEPVLGDSMLGRAQKNGILEIRTRDIRDFTTDKHNKADEYTFGGGQGMVMLPEPIFGALRHIGAEGKRILYMSPRGKIIDRQLLEELASEEELVILAGHYEGVDQRVIDYWNMEEVSIGDYILTGGELPAMVLVDALARLIPGVLSSQESALEESVYSGLLEYPHYTRPREFEGMEVPEVLTNGNHKLIHLWRFRKSLELTAERRPDLMAGFLEGEHEFTKEERKIVDEITGKKA